ncbi:inositol monophosphatase family protein [uncultured Corynebacterium sp.]|uniref:inositol monophosphatase family protein n=1 Tax=uncultured Corynebacterium sp. TaxID=159447 RepID=UPI0026204693|nr:inositol monophosphatase family protein [uncultured Corynebacterium sp.]
MDNDSHETAQTTNSAGNAIFTDSQNRASTHPSVRELRGRAVLIARAAAAHIARRRAELGTDGVLASTQTKTSAVDPVTVVDRESEELIRALIKTFSSTDRIVGEEGGLDDGASSPAHSTGSSEPVTWIVDPIDGTVNFLYGLPNFAVSIACAVGDEVVAGAVANVASGEIYSAARGEGAQLSRWDGSVSELKCSPTTELRKVLVATGFSYSARLRKIQGQIASQLLGQCRDIRRMGSAALDLCMVASGRADAYYEHDIKIWDYAAGALIAAEAGAKVRVPKFRQSAHAAGRPEGDPLDFGVCAATPAVADVFFAAFDGAVAQVRQ